VYDALKRPEITTCGERFGALKPEHAYYITPCRSPCLDTRQHCSPSSHCVTIISHMIFVQSLVLEIRSVSLDYKSSRDEANYGILPVSQVLSISKFWRDFS